MKSLYFGLILIFCFTACKKTVEDLVIDEIKEEQFKTASDLAGEWELIHVRYHYEIDSNDTWVTTIDTNYAEISGRIMFTYLQEDDVEGFYDLSFNDTTDMHEFRGNTLNVGVETLSIKHKDNRQAHLFNDGIFSDFIIEKLDEDDLRLNRKTVAPDYFRSNWYLTFKKKK